ncbi:MAG TPA: glycoside hydrolase family 27 protein [Candidatus Paceibacterota bacterium]|nr:glycoside hydrolase family 27 protein [Candidatus Paceibacterota bacterium]
MKYQLIPNAAVSFVALAAFAMTLRADVPTPEPAYWKFAATPPMGWNSYDALGTSITEPETLANARFMQEKLLAHGWKYIVIDARWYDSVSSFDDRDFNKERAGAKLFADEFGRLTPALNRFPSAAAGKGFKPLADQIHAMGLKFGFHMMRGIPRQAVNAKTPIEGSKFTAVDAGNPKSTCGWCPDMFGVQNNEAGQAWYDSCARLWAAWGIDFIKVDDLSNPYYAHEIEMIRKAIDKCGRPIVFSTSPGPTDPSHAKHVSANANMWRISGDFWDQWGESHRSGLSHQFDLLAKWQGVAGPGHWPDADMIPFGHIGIKCTIAGPDRQTRFTKDEQRTLMSLWAIAPSPLILGNNLPDTDEWTLSLLTNDEVLAVNQDVLGNSARRVTQANGTEIWVKKLSDGGTAIAMFNRGETAANIELDWAAAGLSGKQTLRDLWSHQNLGKFAGKYSAPQIPAHGVLFVKAKRSGWRLFGK